MSYENNFDLRISSLEDKIEQMSNMINLLLENQKEMVNIISDKANTNNDSINKDNTNNDSINKDNTFTWVDVAVSSEEENKNKIDTINPNDKLTWVDVAVSSREEMAMKIKESIDEEMSLMLDLNYEDYKMKFCNRNNKFTLSSLNIESIKRLKLKEMLFAIINPKETRRFASKSLISLWLINSIRMDSSDDYKEVLNLAYNKDREELKLKRESIFNKEDFRININDNDNDNCSDSQKALIALITNNNINEWINMDYDDVYNSIINDFYKERSYNVGRFDDNFDKKKMINYQISYNNYKSVINLINALMQIESSKHEIVKKYIIEELDTLYNLIKNNNFNLRDNLKGFIELLTNDIQVYLKLFGLNGNDFIKISKEYLYQNIESYRLLADYNLYSYKRSRTSDINKIKYIIENDKNPISKIINIVSESNDINENYILSSLNEIDHIRYKINRIIIDYKFNSNNEATGNTLSEYELAGLRNYLEEVDNITDIYRINTFNRNSIELITSLEHLRNIYIKYSDILIKALEILRDNYTINDIEIVLNISFYNKRFLKYIQKYKLN